MWIPDKKTYAEIQKIKEFLRFVAEHNLASESDREQAGRVEWLIENINQPETYMEWNVCLDIIDDELQYGKEDREGVYWREYSVWFENSTLSVTIEDHHTEYPLGEYESENYCFEAIIYFGENLADDKRVWFSSQDKIDSFVSDVRNYRQYCTDTLNEVEIEIDIWGK